MPEQASRGQSANVPQVEMGGRSMTEFCPLPLDTVTKRRFWESLDNRSRSLLSSRPDVLEAIFDTVRVRERYRTDSWERQWKRREWRRV